MLNFRLTGLFLLIISATLAAQSQPDVMISFDRKSCSIVVDTGEAAVSHRFLLNQVERRERSIIADGELIIHGDSLTIGGRTVNLATMQVAEITPFKGVYDVLLRDASAQQSRRSRAGGNAFASFAALELKAGDFIRGSAFVVGGELRSDAEVNGFVVGLFSDLNLGPTSTCHRDVIAIGGSIKHDDRARIYGAIQSTESWKRTDIFRRRRKNFGHQPVSIWPRLSYDRVDGLAIYGGIAFQSEENFVPRFFAEVGYGLESEMGKYRIGFDHLLFDYNQFNYGASVYQQTKTADDWLAWSGENNVYALLKREDFRDYYQGEGVELFVQQEFDIKHQLRAEYFVEELDSMSAHPRLWAVMGGSKAFRSNFSSVHELERRELQQLYTKNEAAISLSYLYRTIREGSTVPMQGWWLSLRYEHSSSEIASDFEYDRITAEARRGQTLGDYFFANLRAKYGKLNGDAPLHRLFYLGGIRTLRGYEIKEFYGTEMGLLNAELIFDPGRTIIDLLGVFDIGTVASGDASVSDSRWAGDYGLGLIVGGYFRFEVTRQFNGHSDDIQPSVLLGASF